MSRGTDMVEYDVITGELVKSNLPTILRIVAVLATIISLYFLFGMAHAVPTTGAATLVGSNNVTLAGTGFAATGWFEWGETSTSPYWKTPDKASTAGAITYRIHSAPLFGSTKFYYRACDATGCGNTLTFTTAAVTPLPTYNLGSMYTNMTENGYDILSIGQHLVDPFLWNPEMPLTIIFMLVFSPVFIGVWLRSRTVIVSLILGFITGGFILYANAGLGLGFPAEVVSLAQALCYVAFAGAVLYIVHR